MLAARPKPLCFYCAYEPEAGGETQLAQSAVCGRQRIVGFLQRVRIARNADRCTSQRILSVRPSVTFRCFVTTNENTIVRFSASVGQSF